jgi:hypothetical protein
MMRGSKMFSTLPLATVTHFKYLHPLQVVTPVPLPAFINILI